MFLVRWKRVLLFLSLILTLAESSSGPWSIWSSNLGGEHSSLFTWTIFSASICVLVALFLSTYLIFEHLAAYNQPEEQKFLIGLVLMVPVYSLESVRGSHAVLSVFVAVLVWVLKSTSRETQASAPQVT